MNKYLLSLLLMVNLAGWCSTNTIQNIDVNLENKICRPTVTQVPKSVGGPYCRDDLIFSDNFDTLNTKYWTNEIRFPPITDDAEFVLYNGSLAVEGGVLKIEAHLNDHHLRKDSIDLGERCTSVNVERECSLTPRGVFILPPVISGRLSTKNYFNFKYGRIEVRAKLPIGDWLFPLISLEPSASTYGAHYKSGEMRIAYARGNNNLMWQNKNINGARLYGGAIVNKYAEMRHQYMNDTTLPNVNHFGDEFHVYTLTWKPHKLILTVDGNEYGSIETNFKQRINEPIWNNGEDNAPFDQMFYITLGLAAGGEGDFPNTDGKPWINTDPRASWNFYKTRSTWYPTWSQPSLEVDYVRVYAGTYVYVLGSQKSILPNAMHKNLLSIILMVNLAGWGCTNTIQNIDVNLENKICRPTVTQVPKSFGGPFCADDLIFSDNFDTLNTKYWTNEIRFPPTIADAEFVLYNGSLAVEGGLLKIEAHLNNQNLKKDTIDLGARCTSTRVESECFLTPRGILILPPVISGRLSTKNYFNFKYGRIEVRAKLPIGDWLFPLISLEPSVPTYGDHYKSGEMRIAYARGNHNLMWQNKNINGARLYGGAIVNKDAELRHQYMKNTTLPNVNHFGDEFHVYTLTWKPDQLILMVDGNEYGRIETNFKKRINEPIWSNGEDNAPFDQMFYITLGLAAGGYGDFPNTDGKPWINTDPRASWNFYKTRSTWYPTWSQPSLEVDYVRVYAV
ncbi:uncharacterized protein LOC135955682 [Calliphora vicina]|uniref:uncharacterized protein LOC135955682 n=1 Tax=Calliphora vicina TaxID=7373 RepID=UPI00325ABC59